ncbi:MAG: hypothetical protein EPN26_08930 [Rhodospirillales bacterium]|nr:MAG: hypothetical protein EPN26_08930 [Rhodospirillales bacterium]
MNLGHTLRWAVHLRPSQIGWRLLRRLQRAFLQLPMGAPNGPLRFLTDPWPGNAENGKRIASDGRILLLNLEHRLATPIDWHPCHKPALWRFTLHYFNWLADLKAAGRADAARALIADWIYQNTSPRSEGWHPYPLSLRLFAWLRHAPFVLEGADEHFRTLFLSSLDAQARLLPRLIEYDVGGNHLIKNLKGLIAASACLPTHIDGLSAWLEALRKQVDEQILPDGFHYERSPSYHLQVLVDLIDISDLMQEPPAWLNETIERMLPALATLRHPDGGLALFNDGDTGDAVLLEALDRRFGKPAPLPLLPDAGYARLEAGDMVVIFDAGLCCPDHLTAHAHADTLSFEMSVGTQRVIVNSGTYAYQDPDWRNYFRSTAAHSTIMVNGQNSAEVFATFRLGRRPAKAELFRDGDWIVGRHDGYRHLGITVERRLRLTAQGLEGEDRVIGAPNPLFSACFHMPSRDEEASGQFIRLSSEGQLAVHEGQYAPHFFEKVPARWLKLSPEPAGSNAISWKINRL